VLGPLMLAALLRLLRRRKTVRVLK
jgi:hypothetical protein